MWGTNRLTRVRVSRVAVIAAAACAFALTGFVGSAGAYVVVDQGSSISGVLVSSQYGLPVVGACVYPILDDLLPSADSLAGDYYAQQTFPGGCSDESGNYTVSIPSALTPALPGLELLVVPQIQSASAQVVAIADAARISVPTANGSVSGYVTEGGSPVPNFMVQVRDNADEVIGVATTDKTGLYQAGITAVGVEQVNVSPLGVVGENFSNDLVGSLTQDFSGGKGVDLVANEMQLPTPARVSGQVLVQGTMPHPWQVVHADCKQGCTSGIVGLTDQTGHFTFVMPHDSKMLIGYGSSIDDGQFFAGTTTLPTAVTVPAKATPPTYQHGPTTWFTAQPAVSLKKTVSWSWTGGSLESSPYEFNTSYTSQKWNGSVSAFTDWQTDRTGAASTSLALGATRCLRVRTLAAMRGIGASALGPSVTQCVTVPLDERVLTASAGWHKFAQASAFNRTVLIASGKGETLSLKGAIGNRLAVVYGTSKKGGVFTVSVNGKTIKSVATAGVGSNGHVVYVSAPKMKKATITLTTTSKQGVSIDGLAVLP